MWVDGRGRDLMVRSAAADSLGRTLVSCGRRPHEAGPDRRSAATIYRLRSPVRHLIDLANADPHFLG